MKFFDFLCLCAFLVFCQLSFSNNDSIPTVSTINLEKTPYKSIHKFWLEIGKDAFNNPIKVPILIAKGKEDGKTLGLTAAIHGNELNGIPIIQSVFNNLDVSKLKGVIIAVPGLNSVAVFNNKRRFSDQVDLNRIFPGKKNGNTSQQIVYQIYHKIIKLFDFHIDMHTASFGRTNSMYVRADLRNNTLAMMSRLQNPDILLASKGNPSFGNSASQTLRATAMQQGIHSITVEYGNPQVYQPEMIKRGVQGIQNLLAWLNMTEESFSLSKNTIVCSKSNWIYTDKGGFLEIPVSLTQKIRKGQVIGILKDPFGAIIKKYIAPEDGIVIGKSTNPICFSGSRIIHLGILEK
ncbi:MAG: succinylglutamate desuccinylase/aspartoacylase family protein [Polaribacter sp.]|nr:succinylglutamate desuccinylase/aspartoacylase family protein [Polaribacter sp.]